MHREPNARPTAAGSKTTPETTEHPWLDVDFSGDSTAGEVLIDLSTGDRGHLKLAVGAVKMLGIPAGLVINRSDMGDDKVYEYAESVDLPILMEIPFDRKIAEAYSRGELLVDVMPEFKENFIKLYKRIAQIVNA